MEPRFRDITAQLLSIKSELEETHDREVARLRDNLESLRENIRLKEERHEHRGVTVATCEEPELEDVTSSATSDCGNSAPPWTSGTAIVAIEHEEVEEGRKKKENEEAHLMAKAKSCPDGLGQARKRLSFDDHPSVVGTDVEDDGRHEPKAVSTGALKLRNLVKSATLPATTAEAMAADLDGPIQKDGSQSEKLWKNAIGTMALANKVRDAASIFEKKITEAKVIDAFKLLDHWVVDETQILRIKSKKARVTGNTCVPELFASPEQRGGSLFFDSILGDQERLVALHPQSATRLIWDVTSLLLWSYDLALLPMVAFGLPQATFFTLMDWLGTLYWTADIGASFITGVYVKGKLERRFRRIAMVYAKTWLPFDSSVVLIDWITIVVDSSNKDDQFDMSRAFRSGRFFRLLRLLRFVRLLRLVKVKRIMNDLRARITSPSAMIVISISQLLFVGLILAHNLACVWYMFGSLNDDGWVYVHKLNKESLGSRYLSSFQFALARLHPSNMSSNMLLKTTSERLLAIFATLVAMVFSSVFISSITTTMGEMKRFRSRRTRHKMILNEYVREHRISQPLALQARKWIDKDGAADQRGQLDKELKENLPEELMTEMRVEAWSAVLGRNSLFNMISNRHPRTEHKLCYDALSEAHVLAGNTIFVAGDACKRMLFTVSGNCSYVMGKSKQKSKRGNMTPDSSKDLEEQFVSPGMWLCEAALFTSWQHLGDLDANDKDDARLLWISADEIAAVARQHEQAFVDIVIYAEVFLAELNGFEGQVTDLPIEAGGEGNVVVQEPEPEEKKHLWNVMPSRSSQLSTHGVKRQNSIR